MNATINDQGHQGQLPIELRSLLGPVTSNIVAILVLNDRWDYDHPTRKLLDTVFDFDQSEFDMCGVAAHFPGLTNLLAWFSKDSFKMRRNDQLFTDYLYQQIESHEKSYDKDNVKDFIDGYITHIRSNRHQFDRHHLYGTSSKLFAAGSDTMRTALEWILTFRTKFNRNSTRELDAIVRQLSPTGRRVRTPRR